MQHFAKWILASAALMMSISLVAQDVQRDPKFLARLSYDVSPLAKSNELQHVCIAVTRDGDYRTIRQMQGEETQRTQGKLPSAEFEQLKKLIESPKFRSMSGNHSGLIRGASETFAAEVLMPGADKAQQLRWLVADGDSQFPDSLAEVVSWLKHFEPTNGKLLEYAEFPDVCPSAGLRLLQPSMSLNRQP